MEKREKIQRGQEQKEEMIRKQNSDQFPNVLPKLPKSISKRPGKGGK